MSPNPKIPSHPVCAVEGCTNAGKPHLCPADGTYHGHGCVHFEHCHSALVFRKSNMWHFVCDEHYQVLVTARRAWEIKICDEQNKART